MCTRRCLYTVLPDKAKLCASCTSSQQGLTPAPPPPALPLSPLLTICQVETFSPKCPSGCSVGCPEVSEHGEPEGGSSSPSSWKALFTANTQQHYSCLPHNNIMYLRVEGWSALLLTSLTMTIKHGRLLVCHSNCGLVFQELWVHECTHGGCKFICLV